MKALLVKQTADAIKQAARDAKQQQQKEQQQWLAEDGKRRKTKAGAVAGADCEEEALLEEGSAVAPAGAIGCFHLGNAS